MVFDSLVRIKCCFEYLTRLVACSASDRQGSNFESCVWRTVSSQSSHHPQEVLLAQFSLYVHKGGLKPDSFHFYLTRLVVKLSFVVIFSVGIKQAIINLWWHDKKNTIYREHGEAQAT